eukprot:GILJ01011474.1.p1 GENE.GILJ01011474.1~~GILJ01011474.1.p1  ORF type:complete len:375 (+),score=48.33 GILJ01011474.1:134-1126(+)
METDIDRYSDFSASFRAALKDKYVVELPAIARDEEASDQTRKWLFQLPDENKIESVFIPEENRGTLCVSSQCGCTLSCKFCHTGTQKLMRNLTATEIIGQLLAARLQLHDFPSPLKKAQVSNVVFMGQGEPLYNFRNVKKALLLMLDDNGCAISKSRVTLSTSGIVPLIEKVAELDVCLAISLHAPTNALRSEIMAVNKLYPLEDLLAACRKFITPRRITFQYVLLKGVNDSPAEAKELARILKGINSNVNIIPFNPWPGSNYECSSPERVTEFYQTLRDLGQLTTIRTARGDDILAACGQLKSAEQVKTQLLNLKAKEELHVMPPSPAI